MIICIDYDNTYTADPALWNSFLQQAKKRGHTIICATMRYEIEGEEVKTYLTDKVDRIIFTDRKAKLLYLQSLGINPDVWIDDNPSWLFNDG